MLSKRPPPYYQPPTSCLTPFSYFKNSRQGPCALTPLVKASFTKWLFFHIFYSKIIPNFYSTFIHSQDHKYKNMLHGLYMLCVLLNIQALNHMAVRYPRTCCMKYSNKKKDQHTIQWNNYMIPLPTIQHSA